MMIDTPEKIMAFRILALRGALKLETLGMKRRGTSAYTIVKDQFGFKGNKNKVLTQLDNWIKINITEGGNNE